MTQHVLFDAEKLLALLDADFNKVKAEYVTLLFAGKYNEAAEILTAMDLIQCHISHVEAL